MARRPTNPRELPDALREAVERTIDATVGSAERSRDTAQGALDDLTGSVEGLRKDAESRLARGRRSVSEALEGRRPATHEDIAKVRAELRAIGRRLDAIEERLPARRAASGKSGAGKAPAKKPAAKRTRAKKNPA
ncbi:MAG TPA: hypothetical protein VFB44_01820 [Thermoleophilaceae bacterium]|nr:hypothetical protein [Thermoleophilaceae bacterium]